MPEVGERSAKPVRTWRPMALWTAGLLLLLLSVWGVSFSVSTVRQIDKLLEHGPSPQGWGEVWGSGHGVGNSPDDSVPSETRFKSCDIPSSEKTLEAVRQLGGPASAARKLRLYIKIRSRDDDLAERAIALLRHCGRDGLDVLVGLSNDKAPISRARAILALGRMRKFTPDVLPTLSDHLSDTSEVARYASAISIRQIGVLTPEAEGKLRTMLAGDCDSCKAQAAITLGHLSKSPQTIVPLLTKALEERSWWVRYQAAWALGEIGPPASDALPALEKLLRDETKARFAAEGAIEMIRGKRPANVEP